MTVRPRSLLALQSHESPTRWDGLPRCHTEGMSLFPSIQSTTGRPLPVRSLQFRCTGKWNGADGSTLVSLQARLKLTNTDAVLSEPVMVEGIQWPDSSFPLLKRDREMSFQSTISAPLTPAAIAFIERERKGAGIGLRLEIWYQWQEPSNQQGGSKAWSSVMWQQVSAVQNVPHSEWIKLLAEMQWAEYELFELASLALEEDRNLAESLTVLRKAQKKLRDGDYAGVLADCREAFESAAKYAARGGDIKTGFDALLTPNFQEHKDKPSALNEFIGGLSKYLHLARHGQYPAIRFTRAEAEFAFATTLSFFSLLSRRLAKLETVD
jgi:hypothetical protein